MNKSIKKKLCVLLSVLMMLSTLLPVSFKSYAANDLPQPIYHESFEKSVNGVSAVKRNHPYDDSAILGVSKNTIKYVDGVKGLGVYFDGSYALKFNTKPLGESFTFSYWMQAHDISNYTPTLMITPTSFSADTFINVTLSDGRISPCVWTHAFYPEDQRFSTGLSGALIKNEWIHVTVCVDGNAKTEADYLSKVTLYLNGYECGTGVTQKGMCIDTTTVWFGVNIWDNLFTGLLDEFSMYDKCLNANQVKALFLQDGGKEDAKNPNDYANNNNNWWEDWWPDWGGGNNGGNHGGNNGGNHGGGNGGNNNPPVEIIYTTLKDTFQPADLLHLKPIIKVTDTSDEYIFSIFENENTKYHTNYYLWIGIGLFSIANVMLFTIYKKNKNRY